MQVGSVLSVPWSKDLRLIVTMYVPKKAAHLAEHRYVAAFSLPTSIVSKGPHDVVIPHNVIHDTSDSCIISGYFTVIPTTVGKRAFTETKVVSNKFLHFIHRACYVFVDPYRDHLGFELENIARRYVVGNI